MAKTTKVEPIDLTVFTGPAARDGSHRRVQITLLDGHYQNLRMNEVADLTVALVRILRDEAQADTSKQVVRPLIRVSAMASATDVREMHAVFAAARPDLLDRITEAVWTECHWTEEDADTPGTTAEIEARVKAKIRTALDRELPFSEAASKDEKAQ